MFVLTLTLAVSLAAVSCRDISKQKPTTNTLSHSILNLGKMEINVYLNEKHLDRKNLEDIGFKQDHHYRHDSPKSEYEILHPSRSQTNLRVDPIIEACPCAGHPPGRSRDSFPQNPTDMLSKILMSNDLFSFNRDPLSSSLCCSSHEQVQEEFFIEFSPKQSPSQMHLQDTQHEPQSLQSLPYQRAFPFFQQLPFLSNNFNKLATMKPKRALELMVLPTKKTANIEKKKLIRPDIQMVGDKKTTMLIDLSPTKSSVKKDLTLDKVGTSLDIAGELVKPTNSVNNSNTL